jgi:hypothetical protein
MSQAIDSKKTKRNLPINLKCEIIESYEPLNVEGLVASLAQMIIYANKRKALLNEPIPSNGSGCGKGLNEKDEES